MVDTCICHPFGVAAAILVIFQRQRLSRTPRSMTKYVEQTVEYGVHGVWLVERGDKKSEEVHEANSSDSSQQ